MRVYAASPFSADMVFPPAAVGVLGICLSAPCWTTVVPFPPSLLLNCPRGGGGGGGGSPAERGDEVGWCECACMVGVCVEGLTCCVRGKGGRRANCVCNGRLFTQ
jgi:hypothetical protein